MSGKSLNHVRVVVLINDEDVYNQTSSFYNINTTCWDKKSLKRDVNGQFIPPPSPPIRSLQTLYKSPGCDNMKAEVLLIGDKCLQLNLTSTEEDEGPYTNISHKMHFDHVSHSAVKIIKSELAIIMDDLLLKRKNSCIMRFDTKQEMNMNIFFDLFITFLNKRIYHQKYKLQYVKLECVNIAATMDNSSVENGFSIRADLAGLADNSDDDCNNNDKTFRLKQNAKNEFRTTRDLMLWLLNEYHYQTDDNKGHEKMQFTFFVVDHHQNAFKVKMTLFNIFLDMMNTEDRNHWHHYMDHLGEGCQGFDCNFIHSGLTISLSGHFDGINSENSLLLFQVPTNITKASDTVEMLEMAHSVVKNRKRKYLKMTRSINTNRRLTFTANDFQRNIHSHTQDLNNNRKKMSRASLPLMEHQSKAGPSTLSFNCSNTSMSRPLCDQPYSNKDFNTLSGWYRKIDDIFSKTCQKSEKYFNRYFELKIEQISLNVQQMFMSLESLYFQQTEEDLVKLQENQLELHELFESYDNAHAILRQLSEEIKDSEFEEILKIYLETKVFDLNNHAMSLKQKNLNLCQQLLKFTFNNLANDIKIQM